MLRIGCRKVILACALLAVLTCSARPLLAQTAAQTWPQRPVKFIVTLGAGSGVDIGMRLLADRLPKLWNQPVVVENRPGGDALVAVSAFIGAHDDHVLLATPTSALTAHPYVLQSMPYKESDLLPIARGWNVIIVIAVPSSLEVGSMKDLVEMTRAQPGKLNWAGTTGAIDFLFAGFLKKYNLDMARVPYRNPQEANNDLALGRIQVAEASLATLRPQLEADGEVVRSFCTLTARHISFVHDAQKILHVTPDLVRDHICTRKVARQSVGEFLEERKIRYTLRSRGQ